MPHAMPVTQVADKLGLPHLKSRQWHIQATCATSGMIELIGL
jgi:ADP-ribosylation factor protein 1